MKNREELARITDATLEPYAVRNADGANWRPGSAKQRQYDEPEHQTKLPFQRDRDRVIHSNAFRRLKHKTQVLTSFYGDHFRDRLTHSLEASQIARGIARQLGLNCDLTETIALTHDLGHTPFGHAGSDTMDQLMKRFGERFDHNLQSRRIVDVLENRYPDFPGLNLTWEVRQGLLKHFSHWESPDTFEHSVLSLEAQVVNFSDSIAYLAADIDDGLRANIISFDGLRRVKLWSKTNRLLGLEYPDVDPESDIGRYQISRLLINDLVTDLASQTTANLQEAGIRTLQDVYESKAPLVGFSAEKIEEIEELKSFLNDNFYRSPKVLEHIRQGQQIIHELFERFYENPGLLPLHVQGKIFAPEPKHTVIKDYIAGMTDNFARMTWENLSASE